MRFRFYDNTHVFSFLEKRVIKAFMKKVILYPSCQVSHHKNGYLINIKNGKYFDSYAKILKCEDKNNVPFYKVVEDLYTQYNLETKKNIPHCISKRSIEKYRRFIRLRKIYELTYEEDIKYEFDEWITSELEKKIIKAYLVESRYRRPYTFKINLNDNGYDIHCYDMNNKYLYRYIDIYFEPEYQHLKVIDFNEVFGFFYRLYNSSPTYIKHRGINSIEEIYKYKDYIEFYNQRRIRDKKIVEIFS